MPRQFRSRAGKICPRFLDGFPVCRYRYILFLHHAVCPRCLAKQHGIVLFPVQIQTVLGHRNQYGLLKILPVQPPVMNGYLRRSPAVKCVQKITVIQKHDFLIFFSCHRIIDVRETVTTGEFIPAHFENTIVPDCLYRDYLLYAFRDNKLFPVLPENII